MTRIYTFAFLFTVFNFIHHTMYDVCTMYDSNSITYKIHRISIIKVLNTHYVSLS